jgi:hypothetical protein
MKLGTRGAASFVDDASVAHINWDRGGTLSQRHDTAATRSSAKPASQPPATRHSA